VDLLPPLSVLIGEHFALRLARRGQRKDGVGPDRHQLDEQPGKQTNNNRSAAIPGAPPQQISGTVRLLMKEVAAIKRDQQVYSSDEWFQRQDCSQLSCWYSKKRLKTRNKSCRNSSA
jgi:hypothetical protein